MSPTTDTKNLATKQDIKNLRQGTKQDFEGLRQDTKQEFAKVRREMATKKQLQKLEKRVQNVEKKMVTKKEFNSLSRDVKKISSTLNVFIELLDKDHVTLRRRVDYVEDYLEQRFNFKPAIAD